MTINSETRVAGPFEGNDSTVAFPFTFKVFDSDELYVVRATDAVETVLELGADFTVALNPDQNAAPGGTVTTAVPLATDSTLTFTSDLEALQPLDLTNQGGFYPRVINNAFDRVTILIQQLKSVVSRTLKFPLSDGPVGDLPGRAARAGAVLAFDNATGEPVVGPNIADVGTVGDAVAAIRTVADNIDDVNTVADNLDDVTNFSDVYYGASTSDPSTRRNGTPLQDGDLYLNTGTGSLRVYSDGTWREGVAGSTTVQNFSGTGSQLEFALSFAPGSEEVTQVFVSGVYQQKNTYEIGGVGGDVLIFSAAPPAGTNNIEALVSSLLPSDEVLRMDLAKTDALNSGAYLVGYRGRTVGARLDDCINVLDYGLVNNAVNTTATVTAALAAAAAQSKPVVFPAGTYTFTDIPNLAASNRHLYAQGRVVLKSTGSGWALDLTAGALNMFNFRMLGDFVIEGNASNTGGVHIQGLHHSIIELRAMNVPGQAFKINYGVLTNYRLTASINVGSGAEWTIVPTTGLFVDARLAGEFTSACWFDLRLEGINGVGLDVVSCQQSSFTGTSEHQSGIGIRTGTGSRYNTFSNVDIEQNLSNDIVVGGYSDQWLNTTCRSVAVTNNIEVVAGAEGNQFRGGDLRCANVNSGSFGTDFDSCRVSDNAALGIKGTGGYTIQNCVRYNTSGVVTARYTDRLGAKGTFSPRIAGAATAGSHTYVTGSAGVGFYSIVGDRCFFEIMCTMTVKDAAMAGGVLITGMPYAMEPTANHYAGGSVGVHGGLVTPTAGYTGVAWRIGAGQSSLTILAAGYDKPLLTLTAGSVTGTTDVVISGSYPIASQL